MSADKALSPVRAGARIYVGTGCAAPRSLVARLETSGSAPADIEFLSFVTTGAFAAASEAAPRRIRRRAFFVGSDDRPVDSTIDYVPMSLEDVPELLARGRLPIDVALLQVSPPDARGFVSLGVSVDLAPAVLRVARHVVAEVNPAMPRTHGASFVHVDRFDALVNVDTPVTEYRHPPTGPIAERIARYIAGIIEDGSTLQIGLGRVPNAALAHLRDRRDLGIHSDVITDDLIDLIEAGVVTGHRKLQQAGRVVTSYCLGTRRLYDLLDDNPLFQFLPIEDVCRTSIVAAHPRMVSITQAFAVDLTGQVCVDQIGGAFYGGVSTQAAFLRGAAQSQGGKPIICLASTTDSGESAIKPVLAPGDGVGIARSDVHYIVTEHGIAYLFGKSIRERALSLIEIAAPRHREALLEAAKKLGYVDRAQFLASSAAYPVHEERRVATRNGSEILLRPARATDADALRGLFHKLAPEDVFTRFFHHLRSLPARDLQELCNVNHETSVAFLAVSGPRESEEVVGSACYFVNPTTNLAEVAFMVAPQWQGFGIGSALQDRLQDYAMARGVRGFVAEILPQNRRMLRLANRGRGALSTTQEDGTCCVTLLFAAGPIPPDTAAG